MAKPQWHRTLASQVPVCLNCLNPFLPWIQMQTHCTFLLFREPINSCKQNGSLGFWVFVYLNSLLCLWKTKGEIMTTIKTKHSWLKDVILFLESDPFQYFSSPRNLLEKFAWTLAFKAMSVPISNVCHLIHITLLVSLLPNVYSEDSDILKHRSLPSRNCKTGWITTFYILHTMHINTIGRRMQNLIFSI